MGNWIRSSSDRAQLHGPTLLGPFVGPLGSWKNVPVVHRRLGPITNFKIVVYSVCSKNKNEKKYNFFKIVEVY